MSISVRQMEQSDYLSVLELWRDCEGLSLYGVKSIDNFLRFLARNPGLSQVVCDGELVVGAVLCGHDGLVGYIHHMAVRASHRRVGVGSLLAKYCLTALAREGIDKCQIVVGGQNEQALEFWRKLGWREFQKRKAMSREVRGVFEGLEQVTSQFESSVELFGGF